jgi:hypothetical protein
VRNGTTCRVAVLTALILTIPNNAPVVQSVSTITNSTVTVAEVAPPIRCREVRADGAVNTGWVRSYADAGPALTRCLYERGA